MSKQSEAKAKQGYVPKAIPQTCVNCGHFKSDFEEIKSTFSTWTKETNIHCGLGGFAVKKMGTCNEFIGKPQEAA